MPKMKKENYEEAATFDTLPELLANTYDVALASPERIATVSDLRAFLKSISIPAHPLLSMDDLAQVHAVRQQVRAVFLAASDDDAMRCLNLLLDDVRPKLMVCQGPEGLSLQLIPAVCDKVAQNVRSLVAVALARSVERYGFSRLRACQATPCRDLFIDRSKKGARRFCGPKCASRTHVSAFRNRKAT